MHNNTCLMFRTVRTVRTVISRLQPGGFSFPSPRKIRRAIDIDPG